MNKKMFQRWKRERQQELNPYHEQLEMRPCYRLPMEVSPLAKRDQFLLLVFSGALAHDIRNETQDAQAIAQVAWQIAEDKIPENVMNAARVFLQFFHSNRTMPFKWMLLGAEQELSRSR